MGVAWLRRTIVLRAEGFVHVQASDDDLVEAATFAASLTAQATTRGNDEWGAIFISSMRRAGVSTAHVRVQHGPTGTRSQLR